MPRYQLIANQPGITDAWTVSRGRGAVVAVVDEHVDVASHPDFAGRVLAEYPGAGTRRRPHGAKVAGLIAADGDTFTGVAPEASILPVSVPTLGADSGSRDVARAMRWAAENGADVICCAWAPRHPSDADSELPADARAGLDWCLTNGRAGNGCVVVFSAGNDGTDLRFNGWASHPGVIAVGACNARREHASYSGHGDALWCVFPSSDPRDESGASTPYLTTAPAGSLLDGEAHYSTRFGLTSAACAAVAGICALIVAANPALTVTEVKAVLRDACGSPHGHSPWLGFGRPDASRAVAIARKEFPNGGRLP